MLLLVMLFSESINFFRLQILSISCCIAICLLFQALQWGETQTLWTCSTYFSFSFFAQCLNISTVLVSFISVLHSVVWNSNIHSLKKKIPSLCLQEPVPFSWSGLTDMYELQMSYKYYVLILKDINTMSVCIFYRILNSSKARCFVSI